MFEKLQDMLDTEFEETLDDLIEVEFNEPILSEEVRALYKKQHPKGLDGRIYYPNLLRLQAEMIKLQDWVVATNAKVLILCEGRDSAGKGGVIKRITQRLDPRVASLTGPGTTAPGSSVSWASPPKTRLNSFFRM